MTQQILSIIPAQNARNLAPQKETVNTMHALGLIDGAIRHLAEARFYMSRSADGAAPVYCSVWVHAPGVHTSGHGCAKGYGYHKESAALDYALRSAGIYLSEHVDGCGTAAMEDAMRAIAEHLGASGVVVI